MDKVLTHLKLTREFVHSNKHLHALCMSIFVFGALIVLTWIHDAIRFIWGNFFRSRKDIKKKYGTWAVITGATDGIGKGLAFEFARIGINVVLLSRTQSKLDECAAEIKVKYPNVEVKVLAVDYGNFNADARKKVTDLLKGVDVGVLINNVGVSYPYPQYFNELTDEKVEEMMQLNINSTTWMTRIVLPGMLDRKRGAIVNMSSSAGMVASPLLAGYSGAKGYIKHFSESLNAEYKGKGIHVQCQVPLFVATKLAKIKNASLFVPSPATFVSICVFLDYYKKHLLTVIILYRLKLLLLLLDMKLYHLHFGHINYNYLY